ncbi:MAG: hypothetical protein HC840_09045 [Leptolyngbyaceae cyanobacterium RM2_2_4]|nr:hypothetical protein [Leptolyngbyaceae cyanobacterium SM1_4_3]NJO49559.1 hypothetical protein [Leptolyngbyaceae cyanobacterium RM2_2_4]
MSQSSDKIISRLSSAADSGEEGGLNSWGGGIKKSWSVRLENLSASIETDQVVPIPGTNTQVHVEVFTVNGKWTSHVRKDEYAARTRIDKKWGDDKNPYGNFTVKAKAVDGGITTDTILDVDNYNDEPNRYAMEKASNLIRAILANLTAR